MLSLDDIRVQSNFAVDGFPIACHRVSADRYIVATGEGSVYLCEDEGPVGFLAELHPVGLMHFFDLSPFYFAQAIDGTCFLADRDLKFTLLGKKLTYPTLWQGCVYYIRDHRLFSHLSLEVPICPLKGIELIWSCGEVLMIMTASDWWVLKKDGQVSLVLKEVLPFTSCAYLVKNNTFHFVMPRGALGLVNLSGIEKQAYVTQGSEGLLTISGVTAGEFLALSFMDQLIFMQALSERFDEYETYVCAGLPSRPLRCLAHPRELLFLVQEDPHTLAIWDVKAQECLWRVMLEEAISCLSLWEGGFAVGLRSGELKTYALSAL